MTSLQPARTYSAGHDGVMTRRPRRRTVTAADVIDPQAWLHAIVKLQI
jgi:hypothetical protein